MRPETHPDQDFIDRLEPLRPAIRLHCYRMLGSSHDGEDVVQETMLRAWRAKDSLDDATKVKPWLYRIATNVCFDELKKRPARLYPTDASPPSDEPPNPLPRGEENIWLEPMPNAWLEGVDARDPHARYEVKESVALAFVAAVQVLSPVQRATLLLRDVIGLSAAETASALETSVEAANSALFRARTTIESRVSPATEVDRTVLERYVRAFESADLDALVALFHRDMRVTMPPVPIWIAGAEANARFFRRLFGNMVRGQFGHVATGANGQPALAFYRSGKLTAVDVIATREGKLLVVDHFLQPSLHSLFGVPLALP